MYKDVSVAKDCLDAIKQCSHQESLKNNLIYIIQWRVLQRFVANVLRNFNDFMCIKFFLWLGFFWDFLSYF